MSPNTKKYLSAILVGFAGVLITVGMQFVPNLPIAVQGLALSAFAGVAHYLDALGHTDRLEAAVAAATKSPGT